MRGYPIDLRSDEQRVRAARSLLGDFEYSAARAVARLTGERVVIQDDNKAARIPDLRIEHGDGRVGHVEITADIDPKYAEMVSQLRTKGSEHLEIPGRVPAPDLGRVWFVTLSARAKVAELRKTLPVILERSTESDLRKLGITRTSWREAAAGEGAIFLYPEGTEGPSDVTWEQWQGALDHLLRSGRVLGKCRKLHRVSSDEKHLFLGTTYTSPWELHFPLSPECTNTPPAPPAVPGYITHCWIMGAYQLGRCLMWSADDGWIDTRGHWRTE